MKHIIVIQTPDGIPMEYWLRHSLLDLIERQVKIQHECCLVSSRFNVSSAIAAVHEMYGAWKWDPASSGLLVESHNHLLDLITWFGLDEIADASYSEKTKVDDILRLAREIKKSSS